jgi:hypothetical protein
MLQLVQIVVYWCTLTAPMDSFNPHQLNASLKFVRENPATCREEPAQLLEAGVTVEQCQSHNMLYYMPGWLQEHPNTLYLGARCEVHRPEPLEIYPLPEQPRAAGSP